MRSHRPSYVAAPAAALLCAAAALSCPAQQPVQDHAQQPPQVTIKQTARTVVVDVVVTDARNNPVTGLTRDDFLLSEEHQPQTIAYFEAHHSIRAADVPTPPPLPPNTYSNDPQAPVTDSVNVLLLDGLNTPPSDQAYVRQQMVEYVRNIPPGTRLAIIGLGTRLYFLQGFTTDRAQLLAALESSRSGPRQSPLLESSTPSLSSQIAAVGGRMPDLSVMQQFEADAASGTMDVRVRTTLQAMQQLGRYLSGIPGRKNVIWFSASFPLSIDPEAGVPNEFSAMRNYSEELRKTSNALTTGQIAVYPVDARGLMTDAVFGAANGSTPGPNAASAAFAATMAGRDSMEQIAEDTGGHAFYNTNDFKGAIAHVIENGANYYTLAYTPTDKRQDGKFRRISIKLRTPGYALAYRRGYFADELNRHALKEHGVADATFLQAMARGAPASTEILVKARVLPAKVQPAPGAPVVGENTKFKGPVMRYTIDIAADLRAFTRTLTPDGLHHSTVLLQVVAYNSDGTPMNTVTKALGLDLQPRLYEAYMANGFQYHTEIDVPRGDDRRIEVPRGEVFLRIGVMDTASGRTGSFEVPLSPEAAAQSAQAALQPGSK